MRVVLKSLFKQLQRACFMAGFLFVDISVIAQDEWSIEQLNDLAQVETWQHLVFLHRKRPEIVTPGFYLAKKHNSRDELQETLTLFKNDEQAKCKFPARYYWLSKQLDFAFLKQDLSECKQLPERIKKFNILFISGYLKNPASSFGHVLVSVQSTPTERLLANAYNFGAEIPENENSLVYMVSGVVGRYSGSFSKGDYYKHDVYYSSRENRDIWEYTLNLTDEERTLLTYHLHELTRFKFNYYFFKQNCAYRTAEILEFIDGLKITKRKTPWFSPEYIMNELVEFDEKSERDLITSINYRPSVQTELHEQFKLLTVNQQYEINDILKSGQLNQLSDFNELERDQIIYFLLRYVELKRQEKPEIQKYADLRTALVRLRIQSPTADEAVTDIKINQISSIDGPKPSQIGVKFGTEYGGNFVMYQRDPLNEGTALNMSFKVLDMQYSRRNGENNIAVDLMNTTKLYDLSHRLYGEQKISWTMNMGLQTDPFDTLQRLHFVEAGAGIAYGLGLQSIIYQLFTSSVHDQNQHIDLKSKSGILFKSNQLAAQAEYQQIFRGAKQIMQFDLTLRKRLDKHLDARLKFSKNSYFNPQVTLDLNHYW